ncbi:FtsQ-type POTRA domain-containing protein [Phormidium yuhuli AB48]|uniref:FtsQ-type POTRA domain-containing protein n=1 Tax=Phormidium yuhuli AB48 TaxID=2940671 RepID=A0ABY5ATD6_9CYAN|nr:FtsQ-type POTRA domain-containing protein [Phormidium yuhuli]USR92300.1 FtsQ-type POTRA domain-containing protein [Phormidium yuhuli AB48]
MTPLPPHLLQQRRHRLRTRRQRRRLGMLWRLMIVGSAAAGSLWFLSHPNWVIQSPEDVHISGNQWLPDTIVRQQLPLSYPETLVQVSPQAIAHHLENNLPLSTARVQRQVLPPRLMIHVQERASVAVALLPPKRNPEGVLEEQVGLLDPEGLWVPMDSHDVLTQLPQLPALRVRGARQVYEQSWPEVYATLKASPVKVEEVTEIDWRDPSQVILKTQTLGSVHLGTLNDRLPEKLKALDGLRYLPQEVEMREVEYIDLQNPDVPYLQKRSSEASESPSSD